MRLKAAPLSKTASLPETLCGFGLQSPHTVTAAEGRNTALKTSHVLRQDFSRVVFSYRFLLCVLIVAGLCFTTPIYTEHDTGKEYNVLLVLAGFSRKQIWDDLGLTFYRVVMNSASSYLTLFIPIVAAFPFITAFCTERNSGNLRLTLFRSGRARYCVSKFLTCAASGGLAVMFGYLLYGAVIFPLFPLQLPTVGYAAAGATISAAGMVTGILRNALGMFLYGAASSLPAFLFSAFIKNRYIIICLPFMLIYAAQSAVSKIITGALSGNYYESVQWMEELSPLSIQKIPFPRPDTWISILINLAVCAAAFLTFFEAIKRKCDCGE